MALLPEQEPGALEPESWLVTSVCAYIGSEAWRLYEYITRHFIATVSYDCKYLQNTISFRIGPEHFTCTVKTVISPGNLQAQPCSSPPQVDAMSSVGPGMEAPGLRQRPVPPGFTEIMPWQSVPLEESLPTCQRGDTFPVGEVKLLEKQTSPPDYLTEAELITLMEKHGIGGCTRPGPRPEGSQPRKPCFHSCPVPLPCVNGKWCGAWHSAGCEPGPVTDGGAGEPTVRWGVSQAEGH